jgi:branched-chain amino acid transport system substrate-binding protein
VNPHCRKNALIDLRRCIPISVERQMHSHQNNVTDTYKADMQALGGNSLGRDIPAIVSKLSRRTLLSGSSTALLTYFGLIRQACALSGERPPIKLGQSAPITGALAKVGLSFRDAARAVFNEVNSQGGVGGRSIELITLDDEDRPERTDVNVKLLASEHQVVALFGFIGAGSHRAGARAANAEGLPYIAAVSGAKELRAGTSPWIYNMRASHSDEIDSVVRHIHQIGIRRVSLVFEYNSEGWEVRDALIASLKQQGDNVASLSSIDHEGSDFSLLGALSSVLAGQPQAILLGADFIASARFVAAARKAGFTGSFYTLSTVGGTALIEKLGPLAEGLSVTQVVPFPWTSSSRVGRDFQAFCVRNKIEPSFASMEAFLASNLVVTALRRAREPTPSGLAVALENLPIQDFGGYQGSFYSKSRRSPGQVDLTVYARSGKFLK